MTRTGQVAVVHSCSQLADLALQAGGVHLFTDHRPEGAVTPASFGRVFTEHGWTNTP